MNIAIIVFYVVIIGAMMYFMAIKPQKKEQKRQQELMDSMEIGDYVQQAVSMVFLSIYQMMM